MPRSPYRSCLVGQNFRRATFQEFHAQRVAHRLRCLYARCRVGALAAQHPSSVATCNQPAQPQLVVLPNAQRGEGRVTTTSETLTKGTLGRGRKRRLGVREQREYGDYVGAIGAAFQRQRALADSGQTVVGIEQGGDATRVAQALETGGSENDRRILAVVQLLQPRVHIAAKRLDVEPR